MRGFEQLRPQAGKFAYADLAGGSDAPAIASSTEFQRRWSVSGGTSDPQRLVEVQVDWTERNGEAAHVRLTSLIARADPADSARLALPAASGRELERPKDRALAIPIEAIPLTGNNRGRSALRWQGPSGGTLVFDDASGLLVAQCAAAPGASTDIAATCTPLPAYLLRGYLRGDGLAAVTGIGFAQVQYLLALPECFIADALDHNDGSRLASWRSYACLMRAADHDGNAGTPRAWSGRSLVEPAPAGSQRVCRDTPDAATTVNEEHPATYALVSHALSQQNFLLLAAGPCPPGTAVHQP